MATAPRMGSVLAVDVGGTKIAAALVSSTGAITARRRAPTPGGGPEALFTQLVQLLEELRAEHGAESPSGVGIGIPAVLEPASDRVVWAPNLPGLSDIALCEPLQQRLGLPVCLEYDGHTAVLGEWWQGAGRGYHNVVCTIIGTGIGGGMIIDGKLYRGRSRLAGAAGWFALASDPVSVDSARERGHWETLAAGPGITRRALAALQAGGSSTLTPHALSAERVFQAARAGDLLAQEIIDETARAIGMGVANIISLLNPDIVVLGGGIGTQADLILQPVRQIVSAYAQPIAGAAARIESSQLGEDAGLLGAAYAAFERIRAEPSS